MALKQSSHSVNTQKTLRSFQGYIHNCFFFYFLFIHISDCVYFTFKPLLFLISSFNNIDVHILKQYFHFNIEQDFVYLSFPVYNGFKLALFLSITFIFPSFFFPYILRFKFSRLICMFHLNNFNVSSYLLYDAHKYARFILDIINERLIFFSLVAKKTFLWWNCIILRTLK